MVVFVPTSFNSVQICHEIVERTRMATRVLLRLFQLLCTVYLTFFFSKIHFIVVNMLLLRNRVMLHGILEDFIPPLQSRNTLYLINGSIQIDT